MLEGAAVAARLRPQPRAGARQRLAGLRRGRPDAARAARVQPRARARPHPARRRRRAGSSRPPSATRWRPPSPRWRGRSPTSGCATSSGSAARRRAAAGGGADAPAPCPAPGGSSRRSRSPSPASRRSPAAAAVGRGRAAPTASRRPLAGHLADGHGLQRREPDPPPDPQYLRRAAPQTIDPPRATPRRSRPPAATSSSPSTRARAPATVNNFVFLAREGFYDGLTFHRVVRRLRDPGRRPRPARAAEAPGYAFDDELPDDGYPPGSVAMANAGPDTNGSQFFIVTGDASALPNDYTRFGRVTAGLDVAPPHRGLRRPRRRPRRPLHPGPDPDDLHLPGHDRREMSPRRGGQLAVARLANWHTPPSPIGTRRPWPR